MCSWCYGFAPELEKIIATQQSSLAIEFVMGGLRPYYNKPISDMKDFLKEHWQHVNEASGQPFSYGILDRSDLNYDTEPPARAVVVVREISPKDEPAFFASVQALFYVGNQDMNIAETYHPVLNAMNLDTGVFDTHFESATMKQRIKADFERARSLGVSSFPSLLLESDGDVHLIANGYIKSEEVNRRIEKRVNRE